MRVLQLNMNYSGTGADRCARELYEGLPAWGIETAMWVGDRRPGDPPEVHAVRNPWERFLAPLEAFPDLTDWRHRGCIAKLNSLTRRDFDLVHIHNIHSGSFSIRAVRDLAARIPSVWTLHDEWAPNGGLTYNLTGKISPAETMRLSRGPLHYIPYHRYHENFKWRRTRRFLRHNLPQPNAVICPSRYMANMAQGAGVFPKSEILHIPNGTRMLALPQASMDRNQARASLGLGSGPVVLMASANLAQPHKGTDLGLAAIRRLDSRLGVQVLLVGGSGNEIAQSLQPMPVVCIHATNDEQLARAYRAADVTIIPSLGENFPYVGLESLACGTPLLSFRIGGLPEIVGQNERGIVCQTLDPGEMSRHLDDLLSSPAVWERMSSQGVKWVHETCGLQAYLGNIVEVYEHVLHTKQVVPSEVTAVYR
jgi:glycosyltransferase involved in cell wall biosynthesis